MPLETRKSKTRPDLLTSILSILLKARVSDYDKLTMQEGDIPRIAPLEQTLSSLVLADIELLHREVWFRKYAQG